MRKNICLILGVFFLASCESPDRNFNNDFPNSSVLKGVANSSTKELTIDCSFDFSLEIQKISNDSIRVTFGGHATRKALKKDGSGIGFDGLAGGFYDVTISETSEIELKNSFENQTPTNFWDAFNKMNGVLTGNQNWEGNWICAPFYTREDTVGTVKGTWSLVPKEE